MKRLILNYLVLCVVFCTSIIFVKRTYLEWSDYSKLTQRANNVLATFGELGSQVNNAAIFTPKILSKGNTVQLNIFFASKPAILRNIDKLSALVRDSVNIKIATQLNRKLRPEVDWIINSNVPDSLLNHHGLKHLTALEEINNLINEGKNRTIFVLNYRQQLLQRSFSRLVTMTIVFLIIIFSLLIYTTVAFYIQRGKIKKKEAKIKAGEIKYKNVIDTIHESLIIEDLNGRMIYANDEFIKTFGFSKDEFGKLTLKDYTADESYPEVIRRHNSRIQGIPEDDEFIYKAKRKDGKEIWIEARVSPLIENGKIAGTQSLERDITERITAEEKIKKSNRMFAFLSGINQCIVHATSEKELLDTACEIATGIGQFKLVYIGLLEGEHKLNITSLGGDNAAKEKVLAVTQLDMDNPVYKDVPTIKALKTGKYNYHNDVQNDPALAHRKNDFIEQGIHASISLPLLKFGKTIGVLGLHAGSRGFFDTDEIALLVEAAGDISFALENFEKIRKHKVAEEQLVQSEKRFRETLENMMEGVQIIGFDWRYLYVNDALTKYSTYPREEMIGRSVMDIYPGVEQTALYTALKGCMEERLSSQLESEFVFPDGSKRDFELSIQPSPEGIFILSVDISEHKKAEQEILKLNRLYAFISAINQSIVHITKKEDLLINACTIATTIGQFKMAWIGLLNFDNKLDMIHLSGDAELTDGMKKYSGLDYSTELLINTATGRALVTGAYALSNDTINDPYMKSWRGEFEHNNVKSNISFPIKLAGKTIGVFGLGSAHVDFFDKQEIALLDEATSDISFALENFEKSRIHKETEDLVQKNERRFRGMIEKSADFKTLTDITGRLTYCSPSVLAFFGYSNEEFLGMSAMSFFHPDDIADLIRKRNEIIDKPGASYKFQYRIVHKNGTWIWCEGTVTNFLHEPAIEGIVTNFRDMSRIKIAEEQKEFDTKNLDALINNTNDLLWSIDRDFKLITFNQPFYEVIKMSTGKKVNKGDTVFSATLNNEQEIRFRQLYTRAFKGEIFTEIDAVEGQYPYAAEISFYPIRQGNEIIGTACYSRDVSARIRQEKEREFMITQLTANNHDLRQFAYITSHNLRGPIANLLGLTNLVDTLKVKDPALVRILKGIKTASVMFDETIKDLAHVLTVRDNPNIQVETTSFDTVFKKATAFCETTIVDCGAEILSDFSAAPTINFSKAYLESIFLNLLTNALKYRHDSRRLKIAVQTHIEDDQIMLRFSDNGIGFDSEMQKEKIFNLYQRFHTHKEGKGLGLFLVKSQLDALGASIMAQSKTDSGSTFLITFAKINKP